MDRDILEELYRKYYRGTVLYCTALCGDEDLAQDITADAFVKAYLTLPDDAPSFRYWLLRVCKNLWIDHFRKRKREAPEELLEYMADSVTPEITYIQNERNRCLWAAVSELPGADRELVTLYYFSGLPLQEIARMTGRNYAAVRQRMVRIRQILKKRMEEQGYGL